MRTPELHETSQLNAWQRAIAAQIAAHLEPELKEQTRILREMLTLQQAAKDENTKFVEAWKRRYGL